MVDKSGNNIITNEYLNGFSLAEIRTDRNGNQHIVENPIDWSFDFTPRNSNDIGEIPSSLHKNEQGFSINGSYLAWTAGYKKKNIFIKKDIVYRAFARFTPNLFINGDKDPYYQYNVQWRFLLKDIDNNKDVGSHPNENDASVWAVSGLPQWNMEHTFEWYFTTDYDFNAEFGFYMKTKWGNMFGEVLIHQIRLEENAEPDNPLKISSIYKNPVQTPIITTPAISNSSTSNQQTVNGFVDILQYFQGNTSPYEISHDWSGGGFETVQTKFDDVEKRRFFILKNENWEELWYDSAYIYRGTDTSPNATEVYQTFENNQYGHRWLPRFMQVGQIFKTTPTIIFKNKFDGSPIPSKPAYQQTFTLRLLNVHSERTFNSGVIVKDVIEIAGYDVDLEKTPNAEPFEVYYYAKKFGLVGWWGRGVGNAFISKTASMHSNSSIKLNWFTLPALQSDLSLVLFPNKNQSLFEAKWIQSTADWTNIRAYPNTKSQAIGKLSSTPVQYFISTESYSTQIDGVWYPIVNLDQTMQGWVRSDVVKISSDKVEGLPVTPVTPETPVVTTPEKPINTEPAKPTESEVVVTKIFASNEAKNQFIEQLEKTFSEIIKLLKTYQ